MKIVNFTIIMLNLIPRNSFFFLIFIFCRTFSQNNLSQFVNPFIGTGGTGHTFPGAVLPFGMVQLSPDTRVDGSWEGCSGYYYTDPLIYGFSHTHLSGTGCSDWGDVLLMPMSGNPSVDPKVYASKFSHANEKAGAGYYEVKLDDELVKAKLTVTPRVGIHEYQFPVSSQNSMVLDLLHRDKLLSGSIKQVDEKTIIGYRKSEAWAKEQYCFFAIQFSEPIKKIVYYKDKKVIKTPDESKNEFANAATFSFNLDKELSRLMVKVGVSGVSADGALANLKTEATHWNFDQYKKEAEETWNKQLSKIEITESSADKKTVFYTALYHCCIHPSLNMDVDNKYRGRDGQIHQASGFTNYSVFSLWDTYRALNPLLTIIEPKRTGDFINTFLEQYKQSKRLPVWELSGNETDCMIGYHATSVITDAFKKGITGFDKELAYSAMLASATYSGFGIPAYCSKKYVSVEDEAESVSRTLEYAYDDWCIAQMALSLEKSADYNAYIKKAQSYKNLFDLNTGFMHARKNGAWLTPFDPREVNNYFTEGNSWQYSFYVPQDIEGLITLHGGIKKFESKLDSLFTTSTKTTGREQADITGLIGQYAHGNEPSHHMAYLYNYVGKPNKTQDLVWKIMNEFYKNSPDGLIGNEDCGQMSAWYIFSSLGFYPVCPGSTEYVIGKPLFASAKINLENEKTFIINNYANTGTLKYIESIKFGNAISYRSAFSHNKLLEGGSMTFSFVSKLDSTNKFGQGPFQGPGSRIVVNPIIVSPVIKSVSKTFEDKQEIAIESNSINNYNIVYTNDGSEPTIRSKKYTNSFIIESSCTIKSKAYFNGDSSSTTEAKFFKRPNNWAINIISKYSKQYSAGGDKGLIDGVFGDENWRKGEWQGHQGQDFECIIDMKEKREISSVSADLLQDSRSWILFPKQVEVYLSDDNKKFILLGKVTHSVAASDNHVQVKKFTKSIDKKTSARYIKVVARNYGTLPAWHQGKGGAAYIFIDEIEIN